MEDGKLKSAEWLATNIFTLGLSVEFQYLHHYGAFTAAVGLSQSPVLNLSLNFGSPGVAVGVEAGYDSLSNTFTKYNAVIVVTKPEASFAIFFDCMCDFDYQQYEVATCFEWLLLFRADKGDLLKASYHHLVHPEKNTIAVAEACRKISRSENAFSIGAAHNIDPFSLL